MDTATEAADNPKAMSQFGDGMSDNDSDDDFEENIAMDKVKHHVSQKKKLESQNTEEGTVELYYLTDLKDIKDDDETKKMNMSYQCSTCKKGFTTKGGLKFHERNAHTEGKLFCLVCRKVFKLSSDLERHMNIHTGNRPFKCSECDKSFVCKSSLSQHERLKHIVGDVYKCYICDKTFNTESDHNRHIRVHTGDKPFRCDQCPKTFTCKSSLNVHKRTHAGKTLKCSHCTMQFYIQSDLKRHETTHTGIKPYKCDLCENSYSCKSSYKVHLRNSHADTGISPRKMVKTQRKKISSRKITVVHSEIDLEMSCEGTDDRKEDMETIDDSVLDEHNDSPKIDTNEC